MPWTCRASGQSYRACAPGIQKGCPRPRPQGSRSSSWTPSPSPTGTGPTPGTWASGSPPSWGAAAATPTAPTAASTPGTAPAGAGASASVHRATSPRRWRCSTGGAPGFSASTTTTSCCPSRGILCGVSPSCGASWTAWAWARWAWLASAGPTSWTRRCCARSSRWGCSASTSASRMDPRRGCGTWGASMTFRAACAPWTCSAGWACLPATTCSCSSLGPAFRTSSKT